MKSVKKTTRDPARLPRTLAPRSRSAALEISFGMIFSIILIIVFLAFGFYAIKKFIDLQNSIQIENFLRDFQQDVNKMWKSQVGSQTVTYPLPSKVTSVCFVDDELQNLKFVSNELLKGDLIENIDIKNMTNVQNPYCIQNTKGKISLTISKDYGETLVGVK